MFLLDTAVVTELRKAKPGQADTGVVAWARRAERPDLFISAITLLELENGAHALERRDKRAGSALRNWVDVQVAKAFEGRILPVDAAVVRRSAQLAYADRRDGLVAATALEHGLTLATGAPAAFKSGRVKLFNPWTYAPEEEADWRQAARTGPLWLKNPFVRA